jgi:isopentenyl-diphosphate delta-isomerase
MARHALRAAEIADAQILIPAIAEDGSLFPVEKMEAHRSGLLHLAVSLFVFSGGEMLIQRRAAGKYHSGEQWANACCSHPNWGESPRDAAGRRLQEELGFRLALTRANTVTYRASVGHGLTEHERVQVFYGVADKARLSIRPNPSEVSETRWASRTLLNAERALRPFDFAPWFRIYLERWHELGLPTD